jgi:hypothetical protein
MWGKLPAGKKNSLRIRLLLNLKSRILSVLQSKEARMYNLTFLYEENGYKISKLEVLGSHYFVVQYTATGRRFIRKTLTAVDAIVRQKLFMK